MTGVLKKSERIENYNGKSDVTGILDKDESLERDTFFASNTKCFSIIKDESKYLHWSTGHSHITSFGLPSRI